MRKATLAFSCNSEGEIGYGSLYLKRPPQRQGRKRVFKHPRHNTGLICVHHALYSLFTGT